MTTQNKHLLCSQNSLVIIVDFQERISRAMFERDTCENSLIRLIKIMNLLSVPFIVTEQYSKGLGPTTSPIREVLQENDQYHPIEKNTFSCFREPRFWEKLQIYKDKKQLLVTGIECHVCVMQTVMDSLSHFEQTFIVTDAVTSRDPKSVQVGLQRMSLAGIIPVTLEMVAFEWLERAGTPEFKAVQKLIL